MTVHRRGLGACLLLACCGCATSGDVVLGTYIADAGAKPASAAVSPHVTVDAGHSDDPLKVLPTNHDHDDLLLHDGAVSALPDGGLSTPGIHSDDVDAAHH